MDYITVTVVNGRPTTTEKMGIPPEKTIRQVWTILNVATLKDENGIPKPIHHENAFIEDQMHDWNLRKNEFTFYGRTTAKDEDSHLLIYLQYQALDFKELPVGKHGFRKPFYDPDRGHRNQQWFSIGICHKEPSGRASAVHHRVKGPIHTREKVYAKAYEICQKLDQGEIIKKTIQVT